MPFLIVRNDITRMQTDAVVNAANSRPRVGGGVDGALNRAAGPGLIAARQRIGWIDTGDAALTPGFQLKARYVIHTVGPVWQGGFCGEEAALRSCYRRSLELAAENGCSSVAFPLISAGIFGYPRQQALSVAVGTCTEFLRDCDMTVYLVVYDRESFLLSRERYRQIADYLGENFRPAPCLASRRMEQREAFEACAGPAGRRPEPQQTVCADLSLRRQLEQLDASFSDTLLELIRRSGMEEKEVYRRANVDRKLFSKIRSNPDYHPSKPTALAFALALHLNMHDTEDLIRRAGYALTRSSKFDLIVSYCMEHGQYDVLEINNILFDFDQSLLGSV